MGCVHGGVKWLGGAVRGAREHERLGASATLAKRAIKVTTQSSNFGKILASCHAGTRTSPILGNQTATERMASCLCARSTLISALSIILSLIHHAAGSLCLQGTLTSLKRHKLDVEAVGMGTECGLVVDGGRWSEWQVRALS